ncbi:MAG: hypothetical protein IT317_11580 [Anaerolineales bacterium]|nr:hypothetical protein [Anaerolineales bacterium]
MLSQLTLCAKRLIARLSVAATRFWRRLMQPAHPSLVMGALADFPRSRTELLAENALLRQQLVILGRRTKTLRLTWQERLSLLILTRWVPNWRQVLQIIQPDTLLRWHREGLQLFWKLKSRRPEPIQPQRPASETVALIERMARENPLRGAERIRGELLKLNLKVSKRTIQKYMQAARSKRSLGQSWSTFLRTHGQDIWACDFVPVMTLLFKTLHVFVIVHYASRRVFHVKGSAHPTYVRCMQPVRDTQ